MITPSGSGRSAGHAADFGIAALVGDGTGERAVTAPYMAPEQSGATSGAPAAADHRADIYALGVVLYEIL